MQNTTLVESIGYPHLIIPSQAGVGSIVCLPDPEVHVGQHWILKVWICIYILKYVTLLMHILTYKHFLHLFNNFDYLNM